MPTKTRREIRITTLLFVYNFLVMCSFSVIKPVRNALLLDRLGPSWLPIGFVGAAIATGLVVYVAGWLSDRIPERTRVFATTVALAANVLLFRWLLTTGGGYVVLAFYIWANVFSNVLITQFWLVAGSLFTAREAKRLFGWVGAGGILGAIVGPVIALWAVDSLGTENLLFVSTGLLVVCLPLVWTLEHKHQPEAIEPDRPIASGLNLFKEFRHLKLIALISGVSLVVQTILDYQFQTIVSDAFATENLKTAFFAKFFAGQNLIGLVLQLLLTRFLLIRFGVGVALLLLPAALAMGSVGILVTPILWIATLAKLGEGSLRYSLQEATREILYLPLPAAVRSRARPLIDIFGARLFEGAGGLLILISTSVFHLTVGGLSWISIALIAIWGVAVLSVKREYLETLRKLFAETPAQSHDRAAEVLDSETVSLLAENLTERDPILVCQALAMLDLAHDKTDLVPHLKLAMEHPAPIVRARTLRLLHQAGEPAFVDDAKSLLCDRDPKIRVEAVRYLCKFGDSDTRSEVASSLQDADPRVRTAAIALLAGSDSGKRGEARASLEVLWQWKGEHASEARAEAAIVLGTLNHPEFDDLLTHLLRDTSSSVVRAALEGVEHIVRRPFVPLVIPYLADQSLSLYAQRAIRSYGDRVLGTLKDYLDDPDEPDALRREIPGCFAAIGTHRAALTLTQSLSDHQREFGDPIIEALGEIRNRHPELTFNEPLVEAALLREAAIPAEPPGIVRLPENHLQLTIGLLALIYPTEDIYRAHAGLTSGENAPRANATELLDNLLRPDLKRAILPQIETWSQPD
jgi:AAA family ATP:ADP antiporter